MRCLSFMPEQARIRMPWRKITRRLWSSSSLMATDAAHSSTASVETDQRSQMAWLTLPSHFLKKNLSTQGAPTAVEAKAAEAEANPSKAAEELEEGVVAKE